MNLACSIKCEESLSCDLFGDADMLQHEYTTQHSYQERITSQLTSMSKLLWFVP